MHFPIPLFCTQSLPLEPTHAMKKHLLTFCLFASCAFATEVQDHQGNTISIQDTKKVITLGGPITEIVYGLGKGKHLIATDTSSYFPEAANQLPKIGYQRSLSAEGIISLKPSLVIGSTESGPPNTLEQLKKAGIPVLILDASPTVEATRKKILTLGKLFGSENRANQMVRSLEKDLLISKTRFPPVSKRPKVLFIYARGAGSVMVSGSGTSADSMIQMAGGVNAVSTFNDYKPITAEAVVTANPDVILMLDKGLSSIGGIEGVLKLPGVAVTPAGKNKRIIAMDDLYLLGFGPRLGQAVRDLTQHLYKKGNP